MSARKCPKCGLVSFATEEGCKRCKSSFAATQVKLASPLLEENRSGDVESRWKFSPLKVLLLILVLAIPFWYYYGAAEADSKADEKIQQEQRRKNGDILCPPGMQNC